MPIVCLFVFNEINLVSTDSWTEDKPKFSKRLRDLYTRVEAIDLVQNYQQETLQQDKQEIQQLKSSHEAKIDQIIENNRRKDKEIEDLKNQVHDLIVENNRKKEKEIKNFKNQEEGLKQIIENNRRKDTEIEKFKNEVEDLKIQGMEVYD